MGESMTMHVPLHLSPMERFPEGTAYFIRDAWYQQDHRILQPTQWFETMENEANLVWQVAPAAADVVAEELGKKRHKRSHQAHMVLVPRMMTVRWRRKMRRAADLYFIVSDCSYWPSALHEPLLVFLFFPFRSDDPKLEERRRLLAQAERVLCAKGMWEATPSRCRRVLCQLLVSARALCPM